MKHSRLMIVLVALAVGFATQAMAKGGGSSGQMAGKAAHGQHGAVQPRQGKQQGQPTREEEERQTREEAGKAAGTTTRERTEAQSRERIESKGTEPGGQIQSRDKLQVQEQERSRDRDPQPDQPGAGQQVQQRTKEKSP